MEEGKDKRKEHLIVGKIHDLKNDKKEEFVPKALKELRLKKEQEDLMEKETKDKEEKKEKIVGIGNRDNKSEEKKAEEKAKEQKPQPRPKIIINDANLNRKEVNEIKVQLDKIVDNREHPMTVPSIDYFRQLATIPPEKRPKTVPIRLKRVKLPKLLREKPMVPADAPKMPAPRRRMGIVGFADTTRMMADFHDPTMEIWGLNELYLVIPRADRWFEMHAEHNIKHSFRDKRHFEWLKNCKIPVYMPKKYKEIPTCKEYPMQLMTRLFGPIFSSSIVEMMALAIYEGFDEIHLYGIDMALTKEYGAQKSGCEYFIGLAVGLGIKVFLPLESDLMKVGFQYGYDDPSVFSVKMKEKSVELKRKIASAQQQERAVHDGVQRLIGANELNDYYQTGYVQFMAEQKFKYQ